MAEGETSASVSKILESKVNVEDVLKIIEQRYVLIQ
jgi:hypothetical protein